MNLALLSSPQDMLDVARLDNLNQCLQKTHHLGANEKLLEIAGIRIKIPFPKMFAGCVRLTLVLEAKCF